jgi:hypothetical protein
MQERIPHPSFQLLDFSVDLFPHMTMQRQFHFAERTHDRSTFGQSFQQIFAFAPAERACNGQVFTHNEPPDIKVSV